VGRLPFRPQARGAKRREDVVANTDKKGAGEAAGSPNDTGRNGGVEQRPDAAKSSGDSPKRHGDPLLHVVKDKDA
jgi:hypothetical protein